MRRVAGLMLAAIACATGSVAPCFAEGPDGWIRGNALRRWTPVVRKAVALLVAAMWTAGLPAKLPAAEPAITSAAGPLAGEELARLLPELRKRVYADLARDQPPLPRGTKIARLTKSPGYEHGCEQLRRLLRDRPALAKDLQETDDLWIATAYLFGGAGTNVRGYWNTQLDDVAAGDCTSFTQFSSESRMEVMLAAKQAGREIEVDELWQSLVFHLHVGLTSYPQRIRLEEQARTGEVSREQYVKERSLIGFLVVRRSRMFYVDAYLPWAIAHGRTTSFNGWYCDRFFTLQEFLAEVTGEDSFYAKYFSTDYDEIRGQELYVRKRYDEAASFFERVALGAKSDDRRLRAYTLMGYCRAHQKDYAAAIENWERAMKLEKDPAERAELVAQLSRVRELANGAGTATDERKGANP